MSYRPSGDDRMRAMKPPYSMRVADDGAVLPCEHGRFGFCNEGECGTYSPSGDVEAVLAEIIARESDGGPDFAAPLAETFGSVAEHRRRLAAAQLRERAASERDDPAAVEHEAKRQAWLARVQRVNWR